MIVFADSHLHSNNSPDASSDTVEALCESAIKKRLATISITDHCEINRYYSEGFDAIAARSAAEARAAAAKYAGRLEVLCGVELGQATEALEYASNALDAREYDVVIASMHNLPGLPDFAFIDVTESNVQELFTRYLRELLGLIEWGRFDILAHMTYPLRYFESEHDIHINLQNFEPQITEIFSRLISAGKALEINTSGYRQPFGRAMPDLWCLKLYKEAGGRLL
ncbi:MAG: histidinol-phosphatase HisJ family protein, partial [Clostridia bacterium]|nr:histidinol-phosphatase HisJ family protein [Clostridia bacterium]